jgi:hypothetical protein
VTETQFYLPDTFPTPELAIEAAVQAGRQKIEVGFKQGSVAVNTEYGFCAEAKLDLQRR